MSGLRLARPGRRFAIACASLVLLAILAVVAIGWYYSSLLHDGLLTPDYSPDELNLRVVSIEGDRITLAPRKGSVESLDDNELWGLEAAAGYGQVGLTLTTSGKDVTRQFKLLSGTVTAGDFARLDSFAFRGDPQSSRGLDFKSVSIPSPLGGLAAWQLDGTSTTWAIFVHGWRSDREEALRILPTVSSLGLNSLVITYRNDEGQPRSPDGLIQFGATEWQDLESAVDYAVGHGATSIVLYGFSTGGGISMSFMEHSDRAAVVSALILDAPMLDMGALLDFQAGRRNIPDFIVAIGEQATSWRFDVDWSSMDYFRDLDKVHAPILLFHGDDDTIAPLSVSQRLAQERSDIVTFIEVHGAGHVRSWNVDPMAYEDRVRQFLSQTIQGEP